MIRLLLASTLLVPALVPLAPDDPSSPATDNGSETETPSQSIDATGPDGAAAVQWFGSDGLEAVKNDQQAPVTVAQRELLMVGSPVVRISEWSEDLLAGEAWSQPTTRTAEWAAPIILEDASRGVVIVRVQRGEVGDHRIEWDAAIGNAIRTNPHALFVRDPEQNAWYLLSEMRVSPINDAAREILAGSLDLDAFARAISDRIAAAGRAIPEKEEPEANRFPVFATGIALGLILLTSVTVVWLRREDGQGE